MGNIGQSLDEDRVAVQAFRSLDSRAVCLVHDFQIQLIQGFNVVAGECDGHKNQIRLAALDVLHDSVLGLSTKPRLGADLRLPAQTPGVAEVQALHDGVDRGSNFGWVRIT